MTYVCAGMTSMTKQVSARQEDLTNPSHASILADELDQVRNVMSPAQMRIQEVLQQTCTPHTKSPSPAITYLLSFHTYPWGAWLIAIPSQEQQS